MPSTPAYGIVLHRRWYESGGRMWRQVRHTGSALKTLNLCHAELALPVLDTLPLRWTLMSRSCCRWQLATYHLHTAGASCGHIIHGFTRDDAACLRVADTN